MSVIMPYDSISSVTNILYDINDKFKYKNLVSNNNLYDIMPSQVLMC